MQNVQRPITELSTGEMRPRLVGRYLVQPGLSLEQLLTAVKTAGKEAISKTTSAMTRPSRPAMASPHTFPRKISSRLVSGAGSIFGGTFGRVKAHPGWAVFGASLGASAFTYSNIPTGPNMVVPADSIQSARAKLRRSTNAVPFGMYYNRRRSIGGL